MRKALLLGIFALCDAPAYGAGTARCDATAFALGKPAATAVKPENRKPAVKQVAAQAAPQKTKAKTTTRLLSTCKDGKKKKSG